MSKKTEIISVSISRNAMLGDVCHVSFSREDFPLFFHAFRMTCFSKIIFRWILPWVAIRMRRRLARWAVETAGPVSREKEIARIG